MSVNDLPRVMPNGYPPVKSKWVHKKKSSEVKHKTRYVTDHSIMMGGNVSYSFSWSRNGWARAQCSVAEWNEWAKDARRVE